MSLLDRRTAGDAVKLVIFIVVTTLATGLLAVTIGNISFGDAKEYKAVFSDATGVVNGDEVGIGRPRLSIRVDRCSPRRSSALGAPSRSGPSPSALGAHAPGSASRSCPRGADLGGGGRGPRPCFASNRAMASGLVAASSQRVGPPHRGHVVTSISNT